MIIEWDWSWCQLEAWKLSISIWIHLRSELIQDWKENWSEENNLQEERKKCIKTVISDSFHS